MTNSQIQAWLDQEDKHVAQMIREHGVFIQWVGNCGAAGSWPTGCGVGGPDDGECGDSNGPDFAYTVGLFGIGHPELVAVNLGFGTAGNLLNEISRRIRAGTDLMPGELLTFAEWPHRVIVEEVPNPGEIVFSANRHYQRPPEASVPVYQLTYDDLHGNFPWDPGYINAPGIQPRPGSWHA